MKRFSKIFSGIAAIMLGVGIILVAFGLGRARSDWDKYKAASQGSDWIVREFANVGDIEINLPFGYLYVTTTTEDKVSFEAVNVDSDAFHVRQAGGKLDISMDGGKSNLLGLFGLPVEAWVHRSGDIGATMQEYQLLLPENYTGELKINFGTGKVHIYEVNAGEMDISLDVGEMYVGRCSAQRLDANCDVGRCTVEGIYEDVSAKVNIGALNVFIYDSHKKYDGTILCELGEMEYHMGVDFEDYMEYDIGEAVYGGEDYNHFVGILSAELGTEYDTGTDSSEIWDYGPSTDISEELGIGDYEDYATVIPRVEAWDRTGGIALRKSWGSAQAEGTFHVKCGVGDVFVTFWGYNPYGALSSAQRLNDIFWEELELEELWDDAFWRELDIFLDDSRLQEIREAISVLKEDSVGASVSKEDSGTDSIPESGLEIPKDDTSGAAQDRQEVTTTQDGINAWQQKEPEVAQTQE